MVLLWECCSTLPGIVPLPPALNLNGIAVATVMVLMKGKPWDNTQSLLLTYGVQWKERNLSGGT